MNTAVSVLGTFSYRDMVVAPSEMKALYTALDRALTKDTRSEVQIVTFNPETLTERLREHREKVIFLSTGSYWGILKNLFCKEIVWEISRSDALKIRAGLQRELRKRKRSTLLITRSWLNSAPIV